MASIDTMKRSHKQNKLFGLIAKKNSCYSELNTKANTMVLGTKQSKLYVYWARIIVQARVTLDFIPKRLNTYEQLLERGFSRDTLPRSETLVQMLWFGAKFVLVVGRVSYAELVISIQTNVRGYSQKLCH